MDKPQTTLTLDLVTKTATITGDDLSVGETAKVIVVNAASADGDTLVLLLIRRRKILAKCESFTLNGSNLEGILDLNTSPMLREFRAASVYHRTSRGSCSHILLSPSISSTLK